MTTAQRFHSLSAMEEWSKFCKVEPYYAFLFHHWEETARANPGFNGDKVQELLWRRWSSLQDEEKSKQQKKDNKTNGKKRRREDESRKVAATLVAEILGAVTEAEDVAGQLIDDVLEQICCYQRRSNFEDIAKVVLGEAGKSELSLSESEHRGEY